MAVDAGSGFVDLGDVDLSDRDFWLEPPDVRHAVFDRLRAQRPFAFFAEPEIPGMPVGPGAGAVLVRMPQYLSDFPLKRESTCCSSCFSTA